MKDTPRIAIYLDLRKAWNTFGERAEEASMELMGTAVHAIARAARCPDADGELVTDLESFVICLYEDSVTYFIEHLNDCLLGGLEKASVKKV